MYDIKKQNKNHTSKSADRKEDETRALSCSVEISAIIATTTYLRILSCRQHMMKAAYKKH